MSGMAVSQALCTRGAIGPWSSPALKRLPLMCTGVRITCKGRLAGRSRTEPVRRMARTRYYVYPLARGHSHNVTVLV